LSATASIEALAAASVHVVESYARSRIELARAEFRQGRVNEGLNTLESLMRSLRSEFDTGEPNQGIDLVLAIAYSVLAQGVEQAGDNETAGGYYRESASRFHQLDEASFEGGMFRGGAREIAFSDSRAPIGYLAARVESVLVVARKLREITPERDADALIRTDRLPPTPTR